MGNSKDYFVAKIVTNEEMQCNGYMDFLLHRMKEQITNGIIAIVSDGNEYAIKMLPEQRIEKPDMMSVEIRQGISVKELVRCSKCRMSFIADESMELYGAEIGKRYCSSGRKVSDDFYCADGERRSE